MSWQLFADLVKFYDNDEHRMLTMMEGNNGGGEATVRGKIKLRNTQVKGSHIE